MRPESGTQVGLEPGLEDNFSSGLWRLGQPSRLEENLVLIQR